jgi:hypothetical protein
VAVRPFRPQPLPCASVDVVAVAGAGVGPDVDESGAGTRHRYMPTSGSTAHGGRAASTPALDRRPQPAAPSCRCGPRRPPCCRGGSAGTAWKIHVRAAVIADAEGVPR